jgi:hypothetical protein
MSATMLDVLGDSKSGTVGSKFMAVPCAAPGVVAEAVAPV